METQATRQYLTFFLSGLELGLDICEVTQIIEHVTPTRVPHLPPVIRGVVNLRGSVVPVVDLAVKLGLAVEPITKRSCMVIVETEGSGRLAILADSVHEVIYLAAADVLPAPEFGVKVRAEYLLGLGKVGDKLVLVIDSKRLLSKEELLAAAAAPLVEPAEASA